MIEKINNVTINDGVKSVYGLGGFSIQDLLSKFYEKINECIDLSNTSLNFLEWLKTQGIEKEVIKEIEKMYQDGRLTNLIDSLANGVKSKIDILNSSFTSLKSDYEAQILEVKNSNTNIKNSVSEINLNLTNKVNNIENTLTTTSKNVVVAINEINTNANNSKNGKIDKTSIVNDVTTGGIDKVLSAEQGKLLNKKIDNKQTNKTNTTVITDQVRRVPFIENMEINTTNVNEYNSATYGTPTITLSGDIVNLNGVINLKSTSSSVTTLGNITKWLLPVRQVLIPTTAFSSDFSTSVASAFAIYGDRGVTNGDLRLETKSILGKNTFISLNSTFRAPFTDLNGAYDFTTKVDTVKNRKELDGDNIPISILLTTDTHWLIPDNSDTLTARQYRTFNWLNDKINPVFSLIMGDYMSEGDSSSGMKAMENKWKAYRYMLKDNNLIMKGNHDDASFNGLLDTTKVIPTSKMWEWSMEGKSELNVNPLEPKNFYYFVDDTSSRTRHIMLNTVDIPYNKTGDNKYRGFNTFVVRQKQIDWLVNVALKIPQNWDVAIYGHHALYENITPTDVELVNRDVIKRILIDFINGADSNIVSTTTLGNSEFNCTIKTDFSTQGQRKLIGYFFGHHHKDFYIKENGINHIGVASMKAYNGEIGAPWDRPQTGNDSFCAECVQIDVVNKKVYLTRFGFGTDRTFNY